MAARNILVVGATGQQGGATIKSLLELPKSDVPIHILALTRDASSAKAKALAEAHKGVIDLVQGDATKPNPIFESQPKGSIDAIFVVTTPGKTREEDQAIPLIDAAVDHGVKHIVFSSVDRGGDEKSWTNPTNIDHFLQKHNIEIHLRDKAEREPGKFTWTIIRPVAFFDNVDAFGSMFAALQSASLRPDQKLQLVSVQDIGKFAAAALTDPAKWAGRAFGLAGDELTLDEQKEVFKRVTGTDLPQTFTILGKLLIWAVKDVGNMFRWFGTEGYGADIEARRKEIPTQNFEAWLRESSKKYKPKA
ncbi:NmrA-like family domain-containing protein 1 [Podospora aff. communis PSN243]|uniref:NmrA-like family domain-containing protein 1 n=1 Tax=Podospora aff. communis PSN243 TaxID=3040156 RepID=A0AAV9GD71_9PEZI|nr:NmrA-like family domain-containing protein 1 [Podospora aff. communis PSN243]